MGLKLISTTIVFFHLTSIVSIAADSDFQDQNPTYASTSQEPNEIPVSNSMSLDKQNDRSRDVAFEHLTALKKTESLTKISENGVHKLIGHKYVQRSASEPTMRNQGQCAIEYKTSGSYILIRSSLFGTELNTKNLVVVRAFKDNDKTYQWAGGFVLGHVVMDFDSVTHQPIRLIVYPGFFKAKINPTHNGLVVCTNFR